MIPMVAVMVSSFVSLGTMPQQLSVAEQNLINRMVRSERKSPSEAWKALQNRRNAGQGKGKRVKGPSKHAVYDYVHGKTHVQGVSETRGRRNTLTKADVRKLMQTRKRLIRQAKGEKRIRYSDIFEEAALETQVSQRTMENSIRQEGVRFRPSRAKVYFNHRGHESGEVDAGGRCDQTSRQDPWTDWVQRGDGRRR